MNRHTGIKMLKLQKCFSLPGFISFDPPSHRKQNADSLLTSFSVYSQTPQSSVKADGIMTFLKLPQCDFFFTPLCRKWNQSLHSHTDQNLLPAVLKWLMFWGARFWARAGVKRLHRSFCELLIVAADVALFLLRVVSMYFLLFKVRIGG